MLTTFGLPALGAAELGGAEAGALGAAVAFILATSGFLRLLRGRLLAPTEN